MEAKKKVIVITGPTASGKTGLSVDFCGEWGGEVINADSVLIYKGMDIGTAKPDIDERKGIPHHLIDIRNPDQNFNVAEYKDLCQGMIDKIYGKNKLPVIVGGTGLYIDAVVNNNIFYSMPVNPDIRKRLEDEALSSGNAFLHQRLAEVDRAAYGRIHENDLKRIIRALEVFETTGIPISEHEKLSRTTPSDYDFLIFCIDVEREALYQKINKRVDFMIEKGLENEVRDLLDIYGYENNQLARTIGYKEITGFIKGEIKLHDAIDLIKQNTRNYAKRQITWFKHRKDIIFTDPDNLNKNIKNYIA